MSPSILLALTLVALAGFNPAWAAEDSAWIKTFNGKDLAGWTPYFKTTGLINSDSTFKFTPEGSLFVDIHLPMATTGFGHLFFTKRKLSYYMVRTVYRFPTATYGAPDWDRGWNMQNNGLMVHSQPPATMMGKEFPNSIEVQLLGKQNNLSATQIAAGFKYGATANLCTPGTFVAYNGNDKYTNHCTMSQYPTTWKNTEIPWEDPQGWSDITLRVLADSLVQHFIHGVKVFEYSKLRLDDGTPLKEGYLAVQAEGTSTQFKSLEILDLVGCMDATKPAYRTYFVKHDAAACNVTVTYPNNQLPRTDFRFARFGRRMQILGSGILSVEAFDIGGKSVGKGVVNGKSLATISLDKPAIYMIRITTASGTAISQVPYF